MKCPACNGNGSSIGVHCVIPCLQCGGTGSVSDEVAEWIRKGESLRSQREGMGLTLFEMAQHLGVTSARIDALEKGRAFNLDFNYEIKFYGDK